VTVLVRQHVPQPQRVPRRRVVEVVTINEAERFAGRERYKAYRDLGHELHNFDQSKS
jgi:DNA polymerase-3 subunit chi